MKRTKGKWYEKDGQIVSQETGKTLAIIPYYDKDNEEDVANVKVMAASKELLKACQNLTWALSQLTEAGFHKEYNEMIEAINKATES